MMNDVNERDREDRAEPPSDAPPPVGARQPSETGEPSPWRARLPVALVVLTLSASLAIPFLVNSITNRARDEIDAVTDPARRLVDQLGSATARESSYLRGFVLTGGEDLLEEFERARATEAHVLIGLPPLLERLNPSLLQHVAEVERLLSRWHEPQDELIAGTVSASEFVALLPEHQTAYMELIGALDRLSQAIDTEMAKARRRNASIQRIGAILTGVLVVLALIAAVLVWRLGEQQRRRVLEEMAVRESTAAVVAATTIPEVIRLIAENAITATNSDSAFVERMDLRPDELEVVAAAGPQTPRIGATTPFSGSFAQEVTRENTPTLIEDVAAAQRPLPGNIAQQLSGWSAAVVPLVNAGTPVGALFLLRAPGRRKFRHDEAERALAFGDLATLAFRKIHMLDESEQRREELEQVTKSRSRLMRGFSHDVKNPLGGADGYLQLLEDGIVGELGPKQHETVTNARQAIASALALIEDLLQIARTETGKIKIEHARTDVGETIRQLIGEYGPQADAKALSLELEIDEELPLIVSDASRIRQVLGNLVSNAVKYTDSGGIIVRAEPRESDEPGEGPWVAIDVQDTGRGIAEDEQQRLFEEFERLDPDRGERGAGLGLAISQRVARALGGTITLVSREGEGSTFTLWLPLRPPGQ